MAEPDSEAGDRAECHDWLVYAASAHRGQAYLYWAQLRAIGEFIDIAVAKLDDRLVAGEDSRDLFDPYTVAVAEVAVLFAVPHDAAREKADKRKNMASRDYGDGLAGLTITADAVEARLSLGEINALIAGVCPNDPRTVGQRRSDAAVARLRGLAFGCGCDDEVTCSATVGEKAVAARQACIVIHAVCQKSTLDGDPYRPTAALDALVKGVFGTCTVPGCEQPSWNCELDHVDEYDPVCPATGGPTCLCNLGPKCLMHHQLKTHLGASDPENGWVDDQWIDDDGEIHTSVTLRHGITVETVAENQWLFPQLSGLRCLHQAQAPPEPAPAGPESSRGGRRAVTAYKHAWRRAQRARIRRDRARVEARWDPPPF